MNLLDKICASALTVLVTVAFIILFTIIIPVFTQTKLIPIIFSSIAALSSIYILQKLQSLNEEHGKNLKFVFYVSVFIVFCFDFQNTLMVILSGTFFDYVLLTYFKLKNFQTTQISLQETIDKSATTPFITYDDTCPDDSEDYGPEGSVIWGPRTIEENICINGKWYINENSEEWEENEE